MKYLALTLLVLAACGEDITKDPDPRDEPSPFRASYDECVEECKTYDFDRDRHMRNVLCIFEHGDGNREVVKFETVCERRR